MDIVTKSSQPPDNMLSLLLFFSSLGFLLFLGLQEDESPYAYGAI